MGENTGKRARGPGRPWKKGQSGNPGGRPRSKRTREYLDEPGPSGKRRIDTLLDVVFLDAVDRKNKDRRHAQELLVSHYDGRPLQGHEVSGPDGAPIKTETEVRGVSARGMTSERQIARFNELLAKATAAPAEATEPSADGGTKPPAT